MLIKDTEALSSIRMHNGNYQLVLTKKEAISVVWFDKSGSVINDKTLAILLPKDCDA